MRKRNLLLAATGILVALAGPPALGSPYFLIDSEQEWMEALGGGGGAGKILPMTTAEWPDYMMQWSMFLREGDPYPPNVFAPPHLYVYGGGGGGGMDPEDAGLVMVWQPSVAEQDTASAWKYEYLLDPNLNNCIIQVTVTPPQWGQNGQINVVSFGIRDAAGAIRAWFWKCPAPIPWNVPTTITINTNLMGLGATNPPATGFMNNPAFNLANSQFFIVDENAVWMGGPLPIPPGGGMIPGVWNYWHNLVVTPIVQSKPPLITKWSQPVVEVEPGRQPPLFYGWDEKSMYQQRPICADDWLCMDQRPVTDIHWWGSFVGWTQPDPPPMPQAFHIGIWTDVPAGPLPFSHPGTLIWQTIRGDFTWNFAGYDKDPRALVENEACFQFNQVLPREEWFYQNPGPNGQRIYWLSIAAIYQEPPQFPWGWKTRPHFFQDDAVRILDASIWPPVVGASWTGGEPIEWEGISWDLAFELSTIEEERLDFGDAPDATGALGYQTLLANNGARHVIVSGAPWLGDPTDTPDAEADGQPNGNATGDDLDITKPIPNDDEDGVTVPMPMIVGQQANIGVLVGAAGWVDAWVDWNGNGVWEDATERIFGGSMPAGANIIAVVPPGPFTGQTFARFRIHTDDNIPLPPFGPASDGEVEDHEVLIEEQPHPEADLGDAPDSTNNSGFLMTAYPPGGPPGVQANYPTVFGTGSPPYGPIHWQPTAVAFLGQAVSFENEADIGPDQDGVNNIIPPTDSPDRDGADDGLLLPLVFPHCFPAQFNYVVTVTNPVPTLLYVNAWCDWNRDGDWDDIMPCPHGTADEWAVQNQMLTFVVPGTYTVTTPQFLPWHPVAPGDRLPLWMRITLSEQPWQPGPGTIGYGGSGPANGYQYGETEDYYVTPEVPEPPLAIAWRSVRTHGILGPLPIVLNPTATNGQVISESRRNGIQLIQVDFDQPVVLVNPAGITVVDAGGGVYATAAVMSDPDTLDITFPPGALPNLKCYRIDLDACVQNSAGQPLAGDTDCWVRGLTADVNNDGSVTISDTNFIRSKNGANPAIPGNARFDLNTDGAITISDSNMARSLNGNAAVPPCP